MEKIIDSKYLKTTFKNTIENSTQDILLKEAELLGFINDSSIYYLKNLYIKYYNPILYIFNKNRFIKMELEKGIINIEIFNRDDIKSIKCVVDNKKNYKLSLMVNNYIECFDASNDTSEEHTFSYNEIIRSIISYLK